MVLSSLLVNCLNSIASTSAGSICSFRNSTIRRSSTGMMSATKSSRSFFACRLVFTRCQNSLMPSSEPRSSRSACHSACSNPLSKVVGLCRQDVQAWGSSATPHSASLYREHIIYNDRGVWLPPTEFATDHFWAQSGPLFRTLFDFVDLTVVERVDRGRVPGNIDSRV